MTYTRGHAARRRTATCTPACIGGSALNPINALARILGDLHDANGRIQLPGFYDRVKPVSNAQRAQWDALGFDEAAFLGDIGLSVPVGERGYSALERLWARPTADINGIWGGYTGAGGKTVIAVGGVAPRCRSAWCRTRIRTRCSNSSSASSANACRRTRPSRMKCGTRAPAIEVNLEPPWVHAAQTVLARGIRPAGRADGQRRLDPGGDSLRKVLGIDTLLMGFGLDDDQVHSPNEKFEQRCFHHGIRSHVRLLAKFAGG